MAVGFWVGRRARRGNSGARGRMRRVWAVKAMVSELAAAG